MTVLHEAPAPRSQLLCPLARWARTAAFTCATLGTAACSFDAQLGYAEVDSEPPPDASSDAAGEVSDADTSSDAGASDEAGSQPEAGSSLDACGPPPPARCQLGNAMLPEELAASTASEVRYYAHGALLRAGRYRIQYVGGCRRIGLVAPFIWTVHAWSMQALASSLATLATGGFAIVLVDENLKPISAAPGSTGVRTGDGTFDSYQACVQANCGMALEFDFAGGALGLKPDTYAAATATADNGGVQMPAFRLSYLDACD